MRVEETIQSNLTQTVAVFSWNTFATVENCKNVVIVKNPLFSELNGPP